MRVLVWEQKPSDYIEGSSTNVSQVIISKREDFGLILKNLLLEKKFIDVTVQATCQLLIVICLEPKVGDEYLDAHDPKDET